MPHVLVCCGHHPRGAYCTAVVVQVCVHTAAALTSVCVHDDLMCPLKAQLLLAGVGFFFWAPFAVAMLR